MRVYNSLKISPASEPMVTLGSHGNPVVQLQEALVNAGYNPKGVDGVFGPGTRAALMAFQRAHGLVADGVAGPSTWRKLAAAGNGTATTAHPAAPHSSGNPTLTLGAKGAAVRQLQQELNHDGFSTGGVDGVFGRQTLAAVDSFQRSRGLGVDGVVGAATWGALARNAPAVHTGPVPSVGGQLGQWIRQAQAILAAHGIPYWKMNAQDLNIIIQHESSGNPNAQNNWDSNAAAGHPSIGLMQTIGPTFDAYKLPGHGNIRNPIDNIIAGVRYAVARYGSISNVPGVRDVHAGLPYVGY